jgi:solute carrier family 35, member E2
MNPVISVYFIVNGISFHFQSITANVLMGYLSPTTYSVSNTVKRALLIWVSIVVFGNAVTMGAWIGTAFMLAGILLYNQAKTEVVKAVSAAD